MMQDPGCVICVPSIILMFGVSYVLFIATRAIKVRFSLVVC